MALNWNDLVQIQEKVREQAERRREIVDEARQNQVAPIPEPQDTFTNLVQNESEEPQPEPQNTPTVEEQKKEETPVVQPVTEPVETVQEQEPVVQPVTQQPKTDRQEETKQPEVVQANDTETLYNDWESYLAGQDRANAVIETGATTQPVDETPLVAPVQKVLGTYPAGTMDYLRENDLPIDWLNTEDGKYWLESRNAPQPEMLFPEDYGGTTISEIPAPRTPLTRDDFLNGLTDFLSPAMNFGVPSVSAETLYDKDSRPDVTGNGYDVARRNADVVPTPSLVTSEQPSYLDNPQYQIDRELGLVDDSFSPETLERLYGVEQPEENNTLETPQAPSTNGYTPVSDLRDYPNIPNSNEPVSYQNDWRTLIDQWENAEAANNELFRESLLNPVQNAPDEPQYGTPRTSGYERAEENNPTGVFQPELLFPTDFGGTSADPYDYPGRNNGYVPTAYLRENPEAGPGKVYDTIANLINSVHFDPDEDRDTMVDITIQDNGLEDTPEVRDRIGALIDQINADDEIYEREPISVTGKDVKNALSDMFDTAKDVASTVYTLNNPGQAIMNEVVKGASDFVNNTLQPGTDRIQIAEQVAIDAGYLPGTPEFDATVDSVLNQLSDKKSRLDEFNEQLLEQPRQERYYRGLENLSRNAMAVEDQRLNNYRNSIDETYNNLVRAGWDPETAKMLALNNDLFGLYDKQGNYIGAKNPEQVYEAPAYNADGTPNATLQAILNGEYEIDGLKGSDLTQADYMPGGALHEDYATQILHSFDVNGGFWENGSVVIPKEIIDLMASNPNTAFGELFQTGFDANLDLTPVGRNAGNVQYANVTDEQWMAGVEAFIKANPALEKLITDGILTQDDIASHFFKAPISAKASGSKPKGSGSGYGYGRYGSGGGGGGGGYGGGGGGSSRGSSASPAKQTEQRINNIMKNWTF